MRAYNKQINIYEWNEYELIWLSIDMDVELEI